MDLLELGLETTPRQSPAPATIDIADIAKAAEVSVAIASKSLFNAAVGSYLNGTPLTMYSQRAEGEKIPIDQFESREGEIIVRYSDLVGLLRCYKSERFPTLRRAVASFQL